MPESGEVTLLLQKAGSGDRAAADQLYRLVEKDLRAIAGKRKQRFANPLDGSTTVLVDDAFCRLVGNKATTWQPGDRGKFFSYIANKMHDLLVEAARAMLAQKRGGDRLQLDLDALDPAAAASAAHEDSVFMIDLKDALERLEVFAPSEAAAFRIYYFLGCTFDALSCDEFSADAIKRHGELALPKQVRFANNIISSAQARGISLVMEGQEIARQQRTA